jgi:mediator of RNA polymerase II transcription subunit 5
MHAALSSLSQRSDLLAQCDAVAKQARGDDSSQDSNTSYAWLRLRTLHADILFFRQRSFIREFIQQLLAVGIIEHAFAVTIDPMMMNDYTSRLQTEAFEHGCSIEVSYRISVFPRR